MTHKFGAHMSIAGGIDRAVFAARDIGFDTVQVFTKNNNQWNAKPLSEDQVAAFQNALSETGIIEPIAHNSYLINLGSPDDTLWHRSIDAMVVELERCEALGIGGLVCHPGAHTGSGEDAGLQRIAKGLDLVHERTRGFQVQILLETTAGQGSCLGNRFEHLRRILQSVQAPERLGVCGDTCHIFAAGYALAPVDQYNQTMDLLDRAVGLGRVRAWHLNDSLKGLGSRVDRHTHIGRGCLGREPFRILLHDDRFNAIPMILETPKGLEDGREFDAINLGVLRELQAESQTGDQAGPSRPRARKAAGDGRRNRSSSGKSD